MGEKDVQVLSTGYHIDFLAELRHSVEWTDYLSFIRVALTISLECQITGIRAWARHRLP